MNHRRRAARAFTLIETSVSVALFTVLAIGVFTMLQDSDRLFATTLKTSMARRDSTRILDQIRLELLQADPASIVIDESSVSHDTIALEVPVSVTRDGIVLGAARVANGIHQDYPDHRVRYLLVPGNGQHHRLLRRIVAVDGTVVAEDELADDIDQPNADSKGLEIERNGNLIRLSLRKRVSEAAGHEFFRTLSITTRIRSA